MVSEALTRYGPPTSGGLSAPSIDRRVIGGFSIADTTTRQLINTVLDRLATGQRTELMFANTNFTINCFSIANDLSHPATIIANDGIGMDIASWMLYRRTFRDNLNGTDFTPRLLESLHESKRLFLVGSTRAAVATAARTWSVLPHVEVVGAADGFESMEDDAALVEAIRAAKPDILLVALGNPKQEEWIVAHRDRINVPLIVGVGALFDFVAGRVRRAPRWMQRFRLEWMFRLLQEPRRLTKRYSVDLVTFYIHCIRTHRTDRGTKPVTSGVQ